MNNEPLKVLLVDDVEENLIALEALLRREGLVLLKARSGAQALELLLANDVSLALLDVQMPEMDGFELAELMRGAERTKHVPIIFVTAGGRDPHRVFKGYESGAVDFLFKPIDPHVLTSKVDVFLELAHQRRQLATALQLNEMFVGILGHDLRNPLGSLASGIELLDQQLTDERQRKVLARMRGSSNRMRSMIDQLLDLTRMRLARGVGVVRDQTIVDLNDLLQHTIDELRAVHEGREIVLEAHGHCSAAGDEQRLNQLFSNLVGNAIAHGTANTRITARIVRCDQEAVIEVHNHGAIPREVMGTLFEPFRAVGRSQSTGLGLGLYIAKQIANAHGGELEVTSSEDRGTVFTVRLPRHSIAA